MGLGEHFSRWYSVSDPRVQETKGGRMGRVRAHSIGAAKKAVLALAALSLSALAVITLAGESAGASATVSGPNCTPSGGGNVCVLSPSATDALSVTGQSSLTADRDIVVDSSASEAAVSSGGSTVKADAIGGPGGFVGSFSPTPVSASAQPDPYAGSSVSHGACSGGSSLTVTGGTQAATAGTYSSLGAGNGGKLSLDPGVYTITGSFSNAGDGQITGAGVTLYFCPGASFSLSGTSSTSLSAPGGNNDFVVFFDGTGSFSTGGVDTNLVGTIYAKSAGLQLHNLTVTGDLVANTISVESGSTVTVKQGPTPPPTTTTTTTTTRTTTTTTTTPTPTPTPTTTPALTPSITPATITQSSAPQIKPKVKPRKPKVLAKRKVLTPKHVKKVVHHVKKVTKKAKPTKPVSKPAAFTG